ncbi:MAG: nucleotidyltransferase family protein [Candidatus Magasanikbacteria bacterium]
MSQKTKQPKTKEEVIEQIKPILEKHKVTKAGIFGSYAREEVDNGSDLDLVIDFEDDKDLLDLAAVKIDLEDKTGLDVDLLTQRSLRPRFRKHIEKDLIIAYE